jgi:thymidine kinase
MFSGKTELLQTFVRRYTIAEKNVIVLVPEWDNRFKKGLILSHAGRELTNTLIVPVKTDDSKQWMSASVNADVIVFEEAQFFSGDIALVVDAMTTQYKEVIVAGLDLDFKARPFGQMPILLAMADIVYKLNAICMRCKTSANRTHRKTKSSELIKLGAQADYEALCEQCWLKENYWNSSLTAADDYTFRRVYGIMLDDALEAFSMEKFGTKTTICKTCGSVVAEGLDSCIACTTVQKEVSATVKTTKKIKKSERTKK